MDELVEPTVVMLNCEVAEPFRGSVIMEGLSAQVGASAGLGDTEQDRDTEPSKPYIAVEVMVTVAALPDRIVVLPGVAPIPKSGGFTS